jgi:predicted AAA+ superfamily ATPase
MSKSFKRFAFYGAMKRLEQKDLRRIVVLTGARRVGKTTIQYQMMEELLWNTQDQIRKGYDADSSIRILIFAEVCREERLYRN